jgi:hypothetical protein
MKVKETNFCFQNRETVALPWASLTPTDNTLRSVLPPSFHPLYAHPETPTDMYDDNSFRSITWFKTKCPLSNQIGSRFQLPALDQQHHWLGSLKKSLKKIADSAICSNRIIQNHVIDEKNKSSYWQIVKKFQRVVLIFP